MSVVLGMERAALRTDESLVWSDYRGVVQFGRFAYRIWLNIYD